ncbi:oxygen-independent coproporphyrinogen III oxidase [Bacillus sp. HMF5848]|uniref:radical SAM family heme chaperone HemW n=1 Tax=Bacillus sp. HMF5848 TaxID=2495421 RepID=UPI000F7A2D17|nr:radical SAM family heme chaperone HemW [Bacillus sp. HMF5848]RSK27906.1 oxygen-independent coproporphyrinogen III oxidase [Bacillus sp. HMF5848]
MKGAYIHIPFCEHICHYCDFNKVFLHRQPVDDYLTSLEEEMKITLKTYPTKKLQSIYVGGGTPTALNTLQLERLLGIIKSNLLPLTDDNVEYTFEANPDGLDVEKVRVLKEGRVNRLSVGVQSFQVDELKQIGRTHTSEHVENIVSLLKEHEFNNINIDLMFGLPTQTLDSFKNSIERALSLQIQHVSAYSLIVEPKTVFYNLQNKGKLHLPPQEDEATMYEVLMEKLDENGLKQYEISNFALPGFESKHNLLYWGNEEYYGFGAGAHSYVNGKRKANIGPVQKYIDAVNHQQRFTSSEQVISKEEKMEEEMFLGLRKISGVSKKVFFERYNVTLDEVYSKQLEDLLDKGLIVNDVNHVALTSKGKLLGNEVFQSFLL